MGNCCGCRRCLKNCDIIFFQCCYQDQTAHEEFQETGDWGQTSKISHQVDLKDVVQHYCKDQDRKHEATEAVCTQLQHYCKDQDRKLEATEAVCKQLQEDLTLERSKRRELKQDTTELQGIIDDLTREAKMGREEGEELRGLLSRGQEDREAMKEEIAYLKKYFEQQLAQSEPVVEQSRSLVQKAWVVLRVLYDDGRITDILHQLFNNVNPNIQVVPMDSSSITMKHAGRVILPVIGASRLGGDIMAAVDKAKLGPVAPIILVYHHLAEHNSRISTPTKDRLTDRALVERCQDMVDVVFWQGNVYDCAANVRAVAQLRRIAGQM